MSDPRDDDRRNDRGSVMVVAALAMVALILFAALAIDVGFIWSSRTQSQNVSDAAAIAAAQTMIVPDPDKPPVGLMFVQGGAVTAGTNYAAANSTVANPSVVVQPTDFEFGNWNLATRTLDEGDPSNVDSMTAVRVNVRMDGTDNLQSPGLLSRLLQTSNGSRPFANGFAVNNTAVAYLGFAGTFAPGEFDLPVAVDSCELTSGNGCNSDFCATVESPTACTLLSPQSDSVGLICGVMHDTTDQNMCWTAFDPTQTNNPLIKGVIDDGNSGEVRAGDAVDIDNGTKTSSLDYLRDKMYGCGKFKDAAGQHRYGSTYKVDSWVVKLPVVECQDTRHCAGGPPAQITGGVCFEIREIVEPGPGACNAPVNGGDKIIKGRALCPNSESAHIRALYDEFCKAPDDESVEPGGCGFGLRANRVVLVE